ncbi:hypothetical protein Tco_0432690 [Tanacetum coccineum]
MHRHIIHHLEGYASTRIASKIIKLLLLGPGAVPACITLSNRLTRIESRDGISLKGSQPAIGLHNTPAEHNTPSSPPLTVAAAAAATPPTVTATPSYEPPHHRHLSIIILILHHPHRGSAATPQPTPPLSFRHHHPNTTSPPSSSAATTTAAISMPPSPSTSPPSSSSSAVNHHLHATTARVRLVVINTEGVLLDLGFAPRGNDEDKIQELAEECMDHLERLLRCKDDVADAADAAVGRFIDVMRRITAGDRFIRHGS